MGEPASPSRRRWTEPGAYLESDRAPDQTDPRRPNRQNAPGRYMEPAREAPRAAARAPYAEPPSGPAAQAADTHLRWKRPEWLNQAPSVAPTPPTDPAPPTMPRYPLDGPETPLYEPDERDPQRQQTDYRATSVRAAYWASRTPSYQPDVPAAPIERDTSEERAYFESYSTRRTPASLAHSEASMAGGQPQAYTPGVTSEVERLRREEKTRGRTAGPAPYFWEMMQKPQQTPPLLRGAFWLVSAALIISALLTASYAGASVYAASKLVYVPQVALKGTPGDAGLAYKSVTFLSRTDHVLLRGWFIPGVTSPGHLTADKTIIVAHSQGSNRTDPSVGLLDLSDALAKHGYAVLAFDMRGSGESASAPTSLGYFEQRDVLGAVDFLRTGEMPYPNLGRPKAIGGWGVSMGAAAMLLAAAQEPALRAIVSDSAYADLTPIIKQETPVRAHMPAVFTPGILEAEQTMYGIDYSAVKPVAVVARIAPRPIFFIHGADDTTTSPDNMTALAQAARQASDAHVQTWLAPNAANGQAFRVDGQDYVNRVVAFFAANLSPAA